MWDGIFSGAAGIGLYMAYKAFKTRDGPVSPPGVAEGTPVREWPKSERRKAFDYQIAQNWKAFLAGGLVLAVVGLAGTVASFVSDSDNVSKEDLIEALAEDPTNTYDREEAACVVDMFEATGVDLTSADSADEFQSDLLESIGGWSDDQLSAFEDCLDEESQARADRIAQLSDQEARALAIDLLVSSSDFPNDRDSVECTVDLLEEHEALRSVLAGEMSVEALEALTYAETACR